MDRGRRVFRALIAIAALVAIAPAAASAETTIATARKNRKTVEVTKGNHLQVRLGSCEGSCGYRWRSVRAPNPRILRYTGTGYSAGVRRFSYGADRAGVTRLKLGYFGPGHRHPSRYYTLRVRVVPKALCEAPSGGTTLLDGRASVVFASAPANVLVGCLRSDAHPNIIFQGGSGAKAAIHVALRGRYAGYVERSTAGGEPSYTARVYDVGTGKQVWNAAIPTAARDEVTAFAVTYQGDAAWIVRTAQTNELWVRAGGAPRMVDSGAVDPSFLSVNADTVYYRKGGAELPVTVNDPPNPTPLGEQDGRGETIRLKRGATIVVRVPTCETTCGNSWQWATNPNPQVLLNVGDQHIAGSSGEFRDFTFTGISSGTTRVGLNYTSGGGVVREFNIRVVVR